MGRLVDPIRAARFILEIDEIRIGEFAEVSGLQNETDVVEYGEGGENAYTHKFRGATKYPPVTLKHGVTQLSPALWAWREAMIHRKTPPMHTIHIVILTDAGEEFARVILRNASPYKWVGPTLKAGDTQIAIESLELGYDDFSFMLESIEPKKRPPKPPPKPPKDPDDDPPKVSGLDVVIRPPEVWGLVGEEVTLTCVERRGGPATEWTWKVDGQDAPGAATLKYKIEKTGKRAVTVDAKNGDGDAASAKGEIHGRAKAKLEVKIVPPRSSVQIGAKQRLTCEKVEGEEEPTEWTWTVDGKTFGGKDSAVIEPEFKELKDKVLVKVVAKAGGESAEAEAEVKVTPFRIALSPPKDRIKLGEEARFESQTLQGGPVAEWTWTVDGDAKEGERDLLKFKPEAPKAEIKIHVEATNAFGIKAEDDAILIVDPPPFRVKIEPNFKEVKPGTEVEFEGIPVEGGPIKTHTWTLLGKDDTKAKPKGKFEKIGEHDVRLVATDAHGTKAEAKARVKVKDDCPDWAPTFTYSGNTDERYWGRYQFQLPDKGPNGENVVGIHWDFGPWNRSIKDAVKAKKAPQISFPDKHDASKPQRYQNVFAGEGDLKKGEFPVAVLIRLQGFPNCAWVIELGAPIKAAVSKKGKSKPGKKIHYDGPSEDWIKWWQDHK